MVKKVNEGRCSYLETNYFIQYWKWMLQISPDGDSDSTEEGS